MKFTCNMCSEMFTAKNLLCAHMKQRHNRITCASAFSCKFTAESMTEMMEHDKSHKREKFKCHFCGKDGLISSQFLNHLRKRHLPNLSNDECPLCSFRGSGLISHIQIMHSQMECLCHICDKKLMGPRNLTTHIYREHTIAKKFPCNTCNKTFSIQQHLERHKLVHTVSEKTIPCDECDKMFHTIFVLETHKRNCHAPKNYLCSQCDFATNNATKLKYHTTMHSDERPFQCDICAKRFKTEHTLKKHGITHTEERREECPVCSKKFKKKSALIVHKRFHEGIYEAYCQPCNKKFVQKYNYKVHVEKHHAGRDYQE